MKYFKESSINYTKVNNEFLSDKELSIAARGLLMTMLSLGKNGNEDWNYSIKGLASILPDSERQITKSLKELEDKGYIVREKKTKGGKIYDWEYHISDHKLPDDILMKSFRHKEKKKKPVNNNSTVENVSSVESPVNEVNTSNEPHHHNEDVAFAHLENEGINKSNKNKFTNILNSIYHSEKKDEIEIKAENYTDYKKRIKENISYDYLSDVENTEQLDELVDIITDTVCSSASTVRVGGESKPSEVVKSVLLKINESHIQYVLNNLRKTTSYIKNIKAYLITSLYNAVLTMTTHIQCQVNHDMYGQNEAASDSYANIAPLF